MSEILFSHNFAAKKRLKKHIDCLLRIHDNMNDDSNEKQPAMDKEEVPKIIEERIARLVEKEKKADISSTGSKQSLRKIRLCRMIRRWIKK